ncbi:unnamed protein product, partial [Oppiella nova]
MTVIENTYPNPINVIPGVPVKLALQSDPLNPLKVVSNTGANRSLIDSTLSLDLVDENDFAIYDNVCDQELDRNPKYSGTLTAYINRNDDSRGEVPELDTKGRQRLEFPIRRGKVCLKESELQLKERTRGVNNGKYLIELKARLNGCQTRIKSFYINIMFCDDSRRQE